MSVSVLAVTPSTLVAVAFPDDLDRRSCELWSGQQGDPFQIHGVTMPRALPSPLPSPQAVGPARMGRFVLEMMEASAGFEPAVEVLQTSALPLG